VQQIAHFDATKGLLSYCAITFGEEEQQRSMLLSYIAHMQRATLLYGDELCCSLGKVYKRQKTDYMSVFQVGVDGFEPPTLCL
jgi:hypothetical protein